MISDPRFFRSPPIRKPGSTEMGGSVPDDVRETLREQFSSNIIVAQISPFETLTDMAHGYAYLATQSRNAVTGVYGKSKPPHKRERILENKNPDSVERDRIYTEETAERSEARKFLYLIKNVMNERTLLSKEQNDRFNKYIDITLDVSKKNTPTL
jgi:hypothetical protein